MIISRTPYRISFFGGGTDYPIWYNEHGGAVLATSINRYCYITCRYLPPFFKHTHRVVYSLIEDVKDVNQIKHPAVRECIKFLRIQEGLEIHHDGDLPARAGLGSSSSFAVGLLHAFHALRGEMPSRLQLALEAIHVERDLIRENVGSQDQVTAAFGGLNYINFAAGDKITVQPVTVTIERLQLLQSHLMLFFTGFARTASEIAAEQIKNTPSRKKELHAMRALVDEALKILTASGDIRDFGKLLHESWKLKRSISARISNHHVDDVYETALAAGAIGGKLLGAGGGGFMLLFVEPDKQPVVRAKLAHLLHVPFAFEALGSQIIFYEPGQAVST
ncbi:MAG: kinase [Kiritimatiellaeota bacterium]|nr:kinase [Kiritimatiellota bacterium]